MDAAHEFRRPLGQLLVDEGILTSEQLDTALRAQYGTEKQLGQVLVELGYVAAEVVESALLGQHAQEAGVAAEPAQSAEEIVAPWRLALDERDALLRSFVQDVQERDARIAELSEELAAAGERIAGLEAERAELQAAEVVPDPEPETAHLLFLPAADGYRLVPAAGPAPGPGEPIDHEGRPYAVERLGPSPLPGSALRCAYLSEAPGRTIAP